LKAPFLLNSSSASLINYLSSFVSSLTCFGCTDPFLPCAPVPPALLLAALLTGPIFVLFGTSFAMLRLPAVYAVSNFFAFDYSEAAPLSSRCTIPARLNKSAIRFALIF